MDKQTVLRVASEIQGGLGKVDAVFFVTGMELDEFEDAIRDDSELWGIYRRAEILFRKGLIERSLHTDNVDKAKIGLKFLEKVDDRFNEEDRGEFVQRVIFENADGMEVKVDSKRVKGKRKRGGDLI